MNIVKVFHADHGINAETLLWALSHITDQGFFARTFELPAAHDSIMCTLYGPMSGDAPQTEEQCYWVVRNPERGGINPPARMTKQGLRPSRLLTVIGVLDGDNVTIYTSYAGALAPRLPGDSSLVTDEEKEEARAFWAEHALSDHKGGKSWEEAEAEVKHLTECYISL